MCCCFLRQAKLSGTTFRHSKLRYSNHFPSRGSPLRGREQSVKAASLSRIESGQRAGASSEYGGGAPAAGGVRPSYGYEALSAASDGSDQEPDEAPEYAPFEMELSGGGESAEGPSSRGSAKVNFPPDVELERRPTGTFGGVAAAAFHRGRGRSMSAWSDISRSSIRFEE
ncbi:jg11571, partial [Pararge aegeria aegeria]